MILDKIYISSTEPIVTNVLWAKPLDGGAFSLYAFLSGKWGLLKLMRDNGTPYPDDDTPGDSADDCYTKEEIDNKLADILGLDAEGIAELKALIEDEDSLTGLLSEIARKANTVLLSDYIYSDDPLPTDCIYKRIVGGSGREFKYLLPKEVRYSGDSYLIFRVPDGIDESFVYIVFKREHRTTTMQYYYNASYNTSTDEVPAWVEDAFGYTRSELTTLLNGKASKEQLEEVIKKAFMDANNSEIITDSDNMKHFILSGTGTLEESGLYTTSRYAYIDTTTRTIGGVVYNKTIQLSGFSTYPTFYIHCPFSGQLYLSILTDDYAQFTIVGHHYNNQHESSFVGTIEVDAGEDISITHRGSEKRIFVGEIKLTYKDYLERTTTITLLNSKVDKSEMSVVPGTGADADKTTITLKQGTSATVLTAHQDISGKENVMPITTATGATLTAVVGNYYRLDNVGTLAITLPTIVGATKLQAITFLLACGSSALVTFASQGSETILYQEDFALEADTTYEVTALWNGSEWTLSRVIYE